MTTWISLYPQWFISERNAIGRRYPKFRVDEHQLQQGILEYYGDLVVRPSGGAKRHPVRVSYPASTPFAFPTVTPLERSPEFESDGRVKAPIRPEFFDRRHQMPTGGLCLFQHDTRGSEGGEAISGVEVLRRAEEWFMGHHTGRWPPDSLESELEAHFRYAGEVLLSGVFYGPDVTGSGRFYLVRDMARLLIERKYDYPPLIMTAIEVLAGGVHIVHDARADLGNIFPWLGNEMWSPEALANREETQRDQEVWEPRVEHGYWWSLNEEPGPFQNGAGLLKELAKIAPEGDAWGMVATVFGSDLAMRSKHLVGLRYPGRRGGNEWLMLTLLTPGKMAAGGGMVLTLKDDAKRAEFDQATVGCLHAHGARRDDIRFRNSTVVQEVVVSKRVAMIGLGALGSKVAELLAQAGVGTFHLCDADTLSTTNVARHVGGLGDFGALKTRVVATRLRDINCYINTPQVCEHSVTLTLEELESFIGPADLVICTTADENVESAINQISVLRGKAALYGRAMRRGTMGRIFLVRPGDDACKACLGRYAQEAQRNKWVAISERDEDVLLHECGRPVIPASAIDLSFVASLIARKALDVLEGKAVAGNHWVWSRDVALDVGTQFDRPFVVDEWTWPQHGNCTACTEPEVTEVLLSGGVAEAIRAEVEASVDAETGGILIGHIRGRLAVVIRATGPGPNAKRTKAVFERDVEFVQSQLEQSASEFGERGLYVGEWHSHLETEPEPSPRDIRSMCGIAEAPNYATRCPVMIIAGLDTAGGRLAALKAWSFPIAGRVYPATLVDESTSIG